jgi:hypothetical protein
MTETTYVSTERLWKWSENFEYPTPFTLFLDIIGWNDVYLGGKVTTKPEVPFPVIGHMEAELLGEALVEYSFSCIYKPDDVVEFIKGKMFVNQPELPLDTGRGS